MVWPAAAEICGLTKKSPCSDDVSSPVDKVLRIFTCLRAFLASDSAQSIHSENSVGAKKKMLLESLHNKPKKICIIFFQPWINFYKKVNIQENSF